MSLADSILKQIEQLGYVTAELHDQDGRVIVAEPTVDIDPAKIGPRRFRQMVRIDSADENSRYAAARQLATQCGMDPDG